MSEKKKTEGRVFEKTGTIHVVDGLAEALKRRIPDDKLVQAELPVITESNVVPKFPETTTELNVVPKMEAVFEEAFKLFRVKNAAYGTSNLSTYGLIGILVRMSDKMARLKNIIVDGHDVSATDETKRDTFMDLLVYCAAAILMIDGDWE